MPGAHPPLAGQGDSGDEKDPRGASRAKAKAKASSAKASGPSGSSGDPPPPPKAAPPKAAPPPPPPLAEESDIEVFALGQSAAPKSSATSRRRGNAPKKEYIAAIGGGQVRYEDHVHRDGTVYSNYHFLCPHHDDCSRTMGLGPRNTKRHGPLEPLAFLHAWRDLPPGEQGHRKTPVPQALVTAFFLEHETEMEAIWSHFATP